MCKAWQVFEHSKNLLRSKLIGDWVVGLVYYDNILKVKLMSKVVGEFKAVEESGNNEELRNILKPFSDLG